MSIERNLLISLLKTAQKGNVEQESVNKEARLPSFVTSVLLEKLQNEKLVYMENGFVNIDMQSRLKIAVKAVELGADVERVGEALGWQEFEAMAALALESNGYTTNKNVRFKHDRRRWEIDIVACRKPLVLCIDCKRWRHNMHPSSMRKTAAAQAA